MFLKVLGQSRLQSAHTIHRCAEVVQCYQKQGPLFLRSAYLALPLHHIVGTLCRLICRFCCPSGGRIAGLGKEG